MSKSSRYFTYFIMVINTMGFIGCLRSFLTDPNSAPPIVNSALFSLVMIWICLGNTSRFGWDLRWAGLYLLIGTLSLFGWTTELSYVYMNATLFLTNLEYIRENKVVWRFVFVNGVHNGRLGWRLPYHRPNRGHRWRYPNFGCSLRYHPSHVTSTYRAE